MAPDAGEKLKKWLIYIGPEPTDEVLNDVLERWEKGEDPPAVPVSDKTP